jgi:hypothetical protein
MRVSEESLQVADLLRFLRGNGHLAALIHNFDWAGTELGPIESWQQSLRSIVAVIINSHVPMVLLWGERGYMIYNDAYSRFAGTQQVRVQSSSQRHRGNRHALLLARTNCFRLEQLTVPPPPATTRKYHIVSGHVYTSTLSKGASLRQPERVKKV